MTSKYLNVAEGILDSAASEYLEKNLESIRSVQDYAQNACGILLSNAEALCIKLLCERAATIDNQNDYYYEIEKPLQDLQDLEERYKIEHLFKS